MGQLNRRALLACLQQLGTASRAELAKALCLSQPTVGRIADDLIEQGIIEEVQSDCGSAANPEARSRAGRPGRVLSLNRSQPRFLGIHMDVRETRFALLPIQPRPTDLWDLVQPTVANNGDWRATLKAAARKLETRNLLGLILSVPGIVDEPGGRVLFSPNLHWTEKTNLTDLIHEIWPLPIVMIQELRALAMGHQTLDPSREDLLAVDFGEGVGSAAIIGGRLYASNLPMSGELGHTPIQGNSRKCGCGAIGCLETIVSEQGLLESYRTATSNKRVNLTELASEISTQGIPQWLRETIDAASSIIAGALNMMGLRKVIVSGVFNQFPVCVHESFQAAVTRGALWQRFGQINCTFAPRHHTAGMVSIGLDRLVMPSTPGVPLAHLPGRRSRATNSQAV